MLKKYATFTDEIYYLALEKTEEVQQLLNVIKFLSQYIFNPKGGIQWN